MAAYVIADVTVTDPTGFEDYRTQVPATVTKYGGRFLARGGKHETLEGTWQPNRLVIIEFPSVEQAKRWHDSQEYRGPKALRQKTAKTNLVVIEGI
jgi:uncharacterized protein (DUF1330 family)